MPDSRQTDLSQQATAYALNELTPAEQRIFEQFLEENPALKRDVEVAREAAALVFRALQCGPAPNLTSDQRQRIRQAASAADDGEPRSIRGSTGKPAAPRRSAGLAARGAVLLSMLAMTACALLLATVSQPPGLVDEFNFDSQSWAVIALENRDRVGGNPEASLAQVTYAFRVTGGAPQGLQFDPDLGLNSVSVANGDATDQLLVMTTPGAQSSLHSFDVFENAAAGVMSTTGRDPNEASDQVAEQLLSELIADRQTNEQLEEGVELPDAAAALRRRADVDFPYGESELDRAGLDLRRAESRISRQLTTTAVISERTRNLRRGKCLAYRLAGDEPTSPDGIEQRVSMRLVDAGESPSVALDDIIRESEPAGTTEGRFLAEESNQPFVPHSRSLTAGGSSDRSQTEFSEALGGIRPSATDGVDPAFGVPAEELSRRHYFLPSNGLSLLQIANAGWEDENRGRGAQPPAEPPRPGSLGLSFDNDADGEDSLFVSTLHAPIAAVPVVFETPSTDLLVQHLNAGVWPPPEVVRVDELASSFSATPRRPDAPDPVQATAEAGHCPWAPSNWLAMVTVWTDDVPLDNVAVDVDFNPLRVEGYRVVGKETAPPPTDAGFTAGDGGGTRLSVDPCTAYFEMVPRRRQTAESPELNFALLERCRRFGWRPDDFIAIHNGRSSIEINGIVATDDQKQEVGRLVDEMFTRNQTQQRATISNQIAVDPAAASRPQTISIDDLLTLRVRYTDEQRTETSPVELEVRLAEPRPGETPSGAFVFNSSVVQFGRLLRHPGEVTPDSLQVVRANAAAAAVDDFEEQQRRFLRLADQARSLVESDRLAGLFGAETAAHQDSAQRIVYEIDAPEDAYRVGLYEDYGYWTPRAETPQSPLPSGYWVYAYPKWYVWSDTVDSPPAGSKPMPPAPAP